jgi:Rhodopirellula transposase DDE domain
MELSAELKATYIETAQALKGSDRPVFMARIVKTLGRGGQSQAARELGWCRDTIRKGIGELESGHRQVDNFGARGRKKAEEKLPNLRADIRALVDRQSQTDPTFPSLRLYPRLSAAEVRRQLIQPKGYHHTTVPTEETLRVKLNQLGYRLRAVQKSRPQKNF